MGAAGSASRSATAAPADRHGPASARRAMCRQRRFRPDLRAKRYDPGVRAGSTPRSGAARALDPGVYRRRRRFVGIAVAIAVTVLTLGAQATFTGSGRGPASAAGAGAVAPERTVRAMAGDSLWSIAEEHRGDVDINRYIDKLVDLNGGTSIQVGQLVRLP
jgi:hypothetical protein